MSLTRAPLQSPDLPTPMLDALAARPGMLPGLFGGPFGANQGLALAQLLGNEAMVGLAGLRDGGLSRVERGLDGALAGAAGALSGVPMLGGLAARGAAVGQQQVEMGVGFGRGALDAASGLVGLASNPVGALQGLGELASRSPGAVHGRNTLAAAGAAMDGSGSWAELGATALGGAVAPWASLPEDEQAWWKQVGSGLVEPYTKAWEQGRVFEAGGRLIFDLASLVGTGGLGAEARAGSITSRSLRAGTSEALEAAPGLISRLDDTKLVGKLPSSSPSLTPEFAGSNLAEPVTLGRRLDVDAPANTATGLPEFGMPGGREGLGATRLPPSAADELGARSARRRRAWMVRRSREGRTTRRRASRGCSTSAPSPARRQAPWRPRWPTSSARFPPTCAR